MLRTEGGDRIAAASWTEVTRSIGRRWHGGEADEDNEMADDGVTKVVAGLWSQYALPKD